MQRVNDSVPLADQTFVALMNSVPNKTIEDAREDDLPEFMSACKKWCKKEASYVLGKIGKRFEKWKKDFLSFAFDPVAIVIWARCYRKHVAIFCNYYVWCTHKQDDVSKCDIFLVYRGDNCFQQTRPMTTEEFAKAQDGVGRVQAYLDELSLKENIQKMHKKQAKEYRRTVDKIESEEEGSESEGATSDEDLNLEKVMEEDSNKNDKAADVVPSGLDLRKQQNKKNRK